MNLSLNHETKYFTPKVLVKYFPETAICAGHKNYETQPNQINSSAGGHLWLGLQSACEQGEGWSSAQNLKVENNADATKDEVYGELDSESFEKDLTYLFRLFSSY